MTQLGAILIPTGNIADLDRERSRRALGPDVRPDSKRKRNYLLTPAYRTTSLLEVLGYTETQLAAYLEHIRWGGLGLGVQACPKCGSIERHYRCASINGWKCKSCAKQFSVLSGTRVHGMKMSLKTFMSFAMHFMEAKDSMSSRELSGLHDLDYQTAHVLTLKIREAIRETMGSEGSLTGYVQADAAYFMKYVRPGNVGTGAALAAKEVQKNAGLDEDGKLTAKVNESMHALVVFVQAGQQGHRRYRIAMIKTENQVDLLTLGQQFCTKEAILITDQHSAYNFFSGEFAAHRQVNHNKEFQTRDGVNTNLAENIFSRIRAAVHGAWHRMSVQNLVEYGWEVAWRQEMVGKDNLQQFNDLLARILKSGRANKFVDYWNKRSEDERVPKEEIGVLREVDLGAVPKKRGRPKKGTVRPKPAAPSPGAQSQPLPTMSTVSAPTAPEVKDSS